MKNRLTKFFTVFLAVVLCIGMAPATGSTAYAASRWGGSSISSWWNSWFGGSNKSDAPTKEEEEQPTDPDAGGKLNLSKSISKNDDGTYTINLEAYATGKVDVSTTESYKPTDIVLVLDQSASMLEGFSTSSEVTYEPISGKTNFELNHTDNLYVKDDGEYYSVNVEYQWDSARTYVYTYNGKTVEGKGILNKGPNLDFYVQKTQTTTESKEVALERAVTQFVNQIQATAKDHNVNYRIAIVGYGSYKGDYNRVDYKNTEILTTKDVVNYKNAKDSDYKNALVDVNVDGQLNQRVQNAIKNIIVEEDTATSADLGMEMAQKILANNPSTAEDRNKVVVMFTDGEPNHSNGFSTNVANTTIGTSKTIKDTYKANVFTVGILQGANPDDTTSDINKYMNYVSSNYPNAVSLTEGKTGSNQGYYMNAKNASQLNSIFKTISSSIETPSTSVTLNGESVLKDVITDNFTLPEGIQASDIKVYTAPFTGKNDAGEYTWGAEQSFSATVNINNNTVDVSGFDYSANYAVTTSKGNQGKKLIVQIPVNIVRTFGGNNIPSNEDTSGIYDKGSMVQAFEVPKVDAPIDYEIGGTTQTIPDGTSVTKESLFEYVKDASNFEYKPDGLKNKFVNLTYTIKDGNDIVGIYTVKAGETTGSWTQVDESKITKLHSDKEYSIECKITPITEGTVTEAKKTATSHVYIEGVTRAFVIDFDKPVTYTKKQVFTENQLSTPEKINAISYKEGTNTYGTLTLNNDKSITYRLNKFMDGIDRYTFNVANNCTQKVNMIPATSVYYDDSFGSTDVNNGGIVYSSDWKAITNEQANEELKDAAEKLEQDPTQGTNYGYDSSYDFIGNSNGTVHKVTGANDATTASIQFTGTGIDVYALTDQTGGKVYATLTNKDKSVKKYLTREYSYKTGKLFHVPVISFNNLPKDNYTLTITIADGSTFYLDGLRIYNPLGTDIDQLPDEAKKAYKTDGELGSKLAYIRDGILGKSTIIKNVKGTVYIDDYSASGKVVAGHNATLGSSEVLKEYTRYGCKTETYLPAGKSLTLTLDKDYSNLQLGLKSSDEKNVATYTINNGDEKTIKSSTDMYYKVTAEGKKITITNTSNAMIEITALKVVD